MGRQTCVQLALAIRREQLPHCTRHKIDFVPRVRRCEKLCFPPFHAVARTHARMHTHTHIHAQSVMTHYARRFRCNQRETHAHAHAHAHTYTHTHRDRDRDRNKDRDTHTHSHTRTQTHTHTMRYAMLDDTLHLLNLSLSLSFSLLLHTPQKQNPPDLRNVESISLYSDPTHRRQTHVHTPHRWEIQC